VVGTVGLMTETHLEKVDEEAEAKKVDANKKGEVAHRRYSPVGIAKELKAVVWPGPRKVLGSLLAVVLICGSVAVGVHWTDFGVSTLSLDLVATGESRTDWVLWALVGAQVLSALSAVYFALRHPSPGDTLASIFGGQITAQGTGITPRQRRLEVRMAVSTLAFFAATVGLGLVL
jgi:preprotein translocase subunit SecE